MRYTVSGMFVCEVHADSLQEAKIRCAEKVNRGEVEIHVMSIDKSEEAKRVEGVGNFE